VVRAIDFPSWYLCCPSAAAVWSASPTARWWQFNFECCPLVQEISSAIHYLSCFGGGLLLRFFIGFSALGVYFFALSLLWDKLCSTSPLHCLCFITVCCLFFRFSGFGCCCLPQEMISMIHYLPVLWGVAYGPPALSLHCLSCVSLLIVQCWD
jgi:hypothetical protein